MFLSFAIPTHTHQASPPIPATNETMHTLPPSSKITFKSIMRMPSPLSSGPRLAFNIQSASRRFDSAPDATKPAVSASVPSTNNFKAGEVGKNRTDWQNSCAILASKVVLQQQNTEKPTDTNNITVNDHKTLDPQPPINKIPKPLTNSDLSSAPKHGSTLRVAYQGVPGAYSEAAAGKAYPACEAIPCDQSEVAFQAVELWIADRAVLPVENSLGGSIHRNYDLLLRHRLHIVGELQLSFRHCLLALPGVRTEQINRVISHPQALTHCELTLTELGLNNNVSREAVADTAGAARFVAANNLRDTAAIASASAAELYNLNILADGIQDDSTNVTRFMMLAREPIVPRTDRPFKTSIVFAQDKGTSVLYKVLSAFAFRDIRLTKIESRPNRNRPIRVVDDVNVGTAKHFEYLFYVDFEASMADVRAQNAIAKVAQFTSFLRVLGSYPINPFEGRLTEAE